MKHSIWRSLLLTLFCLVPIAAKAQVTPDGTTSTEVTQEGNNFTIEQGDRAGDNLFHSFNEFSVPTGGSAGFNNAGDIANIFSRVTGSSISNIDGLLSANGVANLYLINPNGIIFGENARLNLGGSFFASTADTLLFEGDTEFSASNPQAAPLLKINIPIGLNFRDSPGDIINRSNILNSSNIADLFIFPGLLVLPGNSLTLVGGNINFESGIAIARGGKIELGGLSEAGTVDINEDGSLNFPEDVAKADINLSNLANVNVQGRGEGSIAINAQNLSLESGELGESSIRAGNIMIDVAESITLNNSQIVNDVEATDVGAINIVAKNLSLNNEASVSSSTTLIGNGSDIDIDVSDTVSISSSNVESIANGNSLDSEGNAGNIKIQTSNLSISESSSISTSSIDRRTGGNIQLIADIIINSGSSIAANKILSFPGDFEVNGGDITITTNSLSIINEGVISAQSVVISEDVGGRAGNIKITASEDILINNASLSSTNDFSDDGENRDALLDNSVSFDLGSIEINSPRLKVTNGGSIETSPRLSSFLRISSADIIINASESLELSNGGSISSEVFGFNDRISSPGNVTIETANLRIDEGRISVLSNLLSFEVNSNGNDGSTTNAGNLTINTEDLILQNGSLVTAQAIGSGSANSANGGNVTINANEGFILAFPNQNNDIIANAAEGNGGNINIDTQAIFGLEERPLNPVTNDINASSEFGLQGDFSLNTPDFDPTSGLIELPAAVGDASDQISQNPCQQGSGSEFIVTGKGGLPTNPNESLSSSGVEVGLVEPLLGLGQEETRRGGEAIQTNNQTTEALDQSPAIPAQGWVFNDRGEVTLVANSNPSHKIERSPATPASCNSENYN